MEKVYHIPPYERRFFVSGIKFESTEKLFQTFVFNANASDVCEFILEDKNIEKQRTIKMTENGWACEMYLSGAIPPGALYTIGVYMNLSDGQELGWLRHDVKWLVQNREVGEIVLHQEKIGECKANFYIDTNPYHYRTDGLNLSMMEAWNFLGKLWHKIISDWLTLQAKNQSNDGQNESEEIRPILSNSRAGRPSHEDDLWAIEEIRMGRKRAEVEKEWLTRPGVIKRNIADPHRQFRRLMRRTK